MDEDECLSEAKEHATRAAYRVTYDSLKQTGAVPFSDLSAYRQRRLKVRVESWLTKNRLGTTDLWKSDTPPSRQIAPSPNTSSTSTT